MDIKKSSEADLERGRATWFLLGLVLVLAVAYVALEYNSGDGGGSSDMADLSIDQPSEDVLVPMVPPEALMQMLKPRESPPPEPERLRVVDEIEAPAEPDELDNQQPGLADSTGLALTDATADTAALSPPQPGTAATAQNPLNFRVVENLPQFPGGPVELMRWLTRHLRYPKGAQRLKIEGRVLVQFIVETDGSVSSLKIVESLHPMCDNEALRVMRLMPKWTPGVQNDQPCRTMVCIPIVFKL